MSETVVRRAQLGDIDRMYEISVAAHRAGYDALIPRGGRAGFRRRYRTSRANRAVFRTIMRSRLATGHWTFYVAEHNAAVIGYVYGYLKDGGRAVIRGLFVAPASQGQGAGGALFKTLTDHFAAYPISFKVIESNAGARRLYERHGFTARPGRSGSFFGAPEVTMTRLPTQKSPL